MKRWIIIIIAGWLLPQVSLCQPVNWNIEHVKTVCVTGYWNGIECSGDYLFASNSWGIMVYRFIQGEDDEPTLVGMYPTQGSSDGLFLRDTLLYICDAPNHLRIWSVADVNRLYEVGQFEDDATEYHAIQVHDDIAYIIPEKYAHCDTGLRILSVEDPTNPMPLRFVRYQDRNMGFDDFRIKDNYVYISGEGPWPVCGGIYVVNVEDPENPSEMEYYGFDESATSWGVEILDDNLIVPTNDSLYVVSIENPEMLNKICSFEYEADYLFGGNILCRDSILFVFSPMFQIIDFRDIFHPVYLGGCGGYAGHDPILSGNYAIGSSVRIINISNYEDPFIEYDRPSSEYGDFKGIAKQGEYLFVTDGSDVRTYEDRDHINRVRVFSIEDINNPAEVGSLRFVGNYTDQIEIINNVAYVCGRRTSLITIDISEPENLVQSGRLGLTWVEDIVIQDDYAFVAGPHHVYVLSIADPSDIQVVGTYDLYWLNERLIGSYYNLGISGNTLAISGGVPGQGRHFWTYDISNPEALDSLGSCESPTWTKSTGMAVQGEYIYLCDPAGLYVLSVADPQHPEAIFTDQTVGLWNIKIFNGLLFGGNSAGLRIYSLEYPERPELIGEYDLPSGYDDIYVEDNLAYIAGGWDVTIYDISHALGAWYLNFSAASHDFGIVSTDSSASWELEITNQSRFEREITSIRIETQHEHSPFTCLTEGDLHLESGSRLLLRFGFSPDTATIYEGSLVIESADHVTSIALRGTGEIPNSIAKVNELPMEYALDLPFPNPFNSTTTIGYSLPVAGNVSLAVYDLSGREVARLADGVKAAGRYEAVWMADGMASGVYMVCLDAGGVTIRAKVVLVR